MSQDTPQYIVIVNNIYNVITAIEGLALSTDEKTKENLLWQKTYYETRLKDTKLNLWRITFSEEGKLVTPVNPDSKIAIEGFLRGVAGDIQKKLQRKYKFGTEQLENYIMQINKIYSYVGSTKQIDNYGYVFEGSQR